MLLFYMDEQGNDSLSQSSVTHAPFFIMGAMAIQDTQRLSLCDRLRRTKDSFFPGWRQRTWTDSEIKGRYLSQAVRRQQRNLNPIRPHCFQMLTHGQLGRLIDRLFNLIHRFNPTFYFVAIDKANLLQRYPLPLQTPVELAYAHLQIRTALLVAEVYGGREGGIFLADEQHHHERLFATGSVQSIRGQISSRLRRPADIEMVIEKPLWMNRGQLPVEREICQLLDFGLYIVGTAIQQSYWSRNNQWLGRLSPYIARHWNTGAVWDGGITIVPRPQRYPAFPF